MGSAAARDANATHFVARKAAADATRTTNPGSSVNGVALSMVRIPTATEAKYRFVERHHVEHRIIDGAHAADGVACSLIWRESQRDESHLEVVVRTARRYWHHCAHVISGAHANHRCIGDEQLRHLTTHDHEFPEQWPLSPRLSSRPRGRP